jgi:hypothetical protein
LALFGAIIIFVLRDLDAGWTSLPVKSKDKAVWLIPPYPACGTL